MRSEGANATATATGSAGILPAVSPRWYSRGYLPHYEDDLHIQAITFRLHDSAPEKIIDEWRHALAIELSSPAHGTPATRQAAGLQQHIEAELHRRILAYEDAGHGACHLCDPHIADLVQNALLHFDGQHYRLLAWYVMPNHVHVVIEPISSHRPSEIVHSWKSFTANAANKHLSRRGDFWMREYYDRYIRNSAHLANAIAYTESNPVKAGLVADKADWCWSSANRERQRFTGDCRQDAGAPSRCRAIASPFPHLRLLLQLAISPHSFP
ncbi:transposase [Termitidicoccus mucosus]|uniref:transposase n=1 Tax=Termitidicoccus mucosus TaxID=1184151 RepID=UPI0008395E5E